MVSLCARPAGQSHAVAPECCEAASHPAGVPRPRSGPLPAGCCGPRVRGVGVRPEAWTGGLGAGGRRGRRAPLGLCPPALPGPGLARRFFLAPNAPVPALPAPEVAAGAGRAGPRLAHRVGPGPLSRALVGSALRASGSRSRFLPSRRHPAAWVKAVRLLCSSLSEPLCPGD